MSDIIQFNTTYLEQAMTKAMLESKEYVVTVTSVFEEDYFESADLKFIFNFVGNYFREYEDIPTKELIINSAPIADRESLETHLDHVYSMDLDIARLYPWLMEKTDEYLKDKAIKDAIRRSVDVITQNENTNDIRKMVEDALCKTLTPDIGIKYFEECGQRLHRMFTDDTQRLPTGFAMFDEFINGGFPPKTLSVFVAKIHGFKSNVMANMIARQVLAGKNIALASLEMSEDMFAQRFDGIYSLLDINKIYWHEDYQRRVFERLRDVKRTEGRGELFIKSFPTGKATVNDFRIWLRELKMRGIEIDGFYFDYLNLMGSEEIKKGGDNSYGVVKSIAEETRAMGFEFDIPMISVSQLNRSGTFMSFEDVDFNSIAESIGVPATADFMMIMGSNDENMVYQNEVHYKIVKNRLGGRVGEMDKFFYDGRSMKMYCSTEQQQWLDDVTISRDDRLLSQHDNDESRPAGQRS